MGENKEMFLFVEIRGVKECIGLDVTEKDWGKMSESERKILTDEVVFDFVNIWVEARFSKEDGSPKDVD
jgi:hypothetical protein